MILSKFPSNKMRLGTEHPRRVGCAKSGLGRLAVFTGYQNGLILPPTLDG